MKTRKTFHKLMFASGRIVEEPKDLTAKKFHNFITKFEVSKLFDSSLPIRIKLEGGDSDAYYDVCNKNSTGANAKEIQVDLFQDYILLSIEV